MFTFHTQVDKYIFTKSICCAVMANSIFGCSTITEILNDAYFEDFYTKERYYAVRVGHVDIDYSLSVRDAFVAVLEKKPRVYKVILEHVGGGYKDNPDCISFVIFASFLSSLLGKYKGEIAARFLHAKFVDECNSMTETFSTWRERGNQFAGVLKDHPEFNTMVGRVSDFLSFNDIEVVVNLIKCSKINEALTFISTEERLALIIGAKLFVKMYGVMVKDSGSFTGFLTSVRDDLFYNKGPLPNKVITYAYTYRCPLVIGAFLGAGYMNYFFKLPPVNTPLPVSNVVQEAITQPVITQPTPKVVPRNYEFKDPTVKSYYDIFLGTATEITYAITNTISECRKAAFVGLFGQDAYDWLIKVIQDSLNMKGGEAKIEDIKNAVSTPKVEDIKNVVTPKVEDIKNVVSTPKVEDIKNVVSTPKK